MNGVPKCNGQVDEYGHAACDGPNVHRVIASFDNGTPFYADWCSTCRLSAIDQGYNFVYASVAQPLEGTRVENGVSA